MMSRTRKARPGLLGWSALVLLSAPLAHAQPGPVAAPSATPGAASTAGAKEGECVGDRFIVLVESGLDPALAEEVRTDFATELAHRGLAICDAASTKREPAAVVALRAADTAVVIELDDRVTHKRVGRDLSLQSIPANGRALAIAIAIDELLRASWAELTLRGPREPDEEEDDDSYRVAETRTVNARGRVRTPTRYQLAGDLSYLHAARNFDAFALGMRGSLRPWGWGWFELGLGGLSSVPARSSAGDVVAAGFRSELTVGACARPRASMFGCAGVRSELDVMRFRGVRAEMARTRSETTPVVQSSLVGLLAVRLRANTYMFGELGLGAVLHGAEATDGTRTLMGMTGMLFSLSLGVGYEL